MKFLLLLVSADGAVTTAPLSIRQLREFPGGDGLSVHFRPVRNDQLFDSAKAAGRLAYRILSGEGKVRAQLWVEYEVLGPHANVTGRSSDLLFALALIASKWKVKSGLPAAIAATGVLDTDGAALSMDRVAAIHAVKHTVAKVEAAVGALADEPEALIFFPATDAEPVVEWSRSAGVRPSVKLLPVHSLEEALSHLGIELEKVYLGNPFRGLNTFEFEHRAIFFGREREVREVVKLLLRREQMGTPGLMVEGASGCGKSSFLRAGVLPALANSGARSEAIGDCIHQRESSAGINRAIWRAGLLPSAPDEATIAGSIRDCWAVLPELSVQAWDQEIRTLADLAKWRLAAWPTHMRFIWLIDQFEEIFNQDLVDPLIEKLGLFLEVMQSEGVWTLASIRADAVPDLKDFAAMRRVFGANDGTYYLATLAGPSLDDVIRRPARAANLTFEIGTDGKALDELIREDIYREQDSLPQLQFTLNELYIRRTCNELSYESYRQIGGLAGSIASAASTVLKGETKDSLPEVRQLFRNLVSVDELGNASRRYAPMAEIVDPAQKRLLARLVESRLCVTDQRNGQAIVAFAHEALLRSWPELADWLREETGLLQTREMALRETHLWQKHGQSPAWLAPVDKVASLEALAAAGIVVSEPVRNFIEQSRRRVRRATRIRQSIFAVITILAIIASGAGWMASKKRHEAELQTADANRQRLRAEAEARASRATADFLTAIFEAPTPEKSLGHPVSARDLLDMGARRLQTELDRTPAIKWRLIANIGNDYRLIGALDRAQPLLEAAVAAYDKLALKDDRDQVDALNELGTLYADMGRPEDAYPTLTRAVALEAALPAERRTVRPRLNLVRVEIQRNQKAEALADLDAAAIRIQGAPTETLDNVDLFMRYALLYESKGMFKKAIEYNNQALVVSRRVFGADSPAALRALQALALDYNNAGDLKTAGSYYDQQLSIMESIYGPEHPNVATVLMDYAINKAEQGDAGAAEPLFRRVLAIRERVFGNDNINTAYALDNLGQLLIDLGRYKEALLLLQRSERIYVHAEGPKHPDVAFALNTQSSALLELHRPAEAREQAVRALRINEEAHGDQHPLVARSLYHIAAADLAEHHDALAVSELERGLKIAELTWHDSYFQMQPFLEDFAKALNRVGRKAEAVELGKRLEKLRAAYTGKK